MTSLSEYIAFLETLNEASAIYTDRLIWMSPQYLQLLGYQTLDEVQGRTIYGATHPDEFIDQQKNIETRQKTGQKTSGTWRMRRKDDTYIKIHSKGSVITLDNETYLVAIARSHQEITHPQYTSSNIKHDTHTPLTAAQGYLEIIETKLTDPENKILLKKAQRNLDTLQETLQKYIQELNQQNLIKK